MKILFGRASYFSWWSSEMSLLHFDYNLALGYFQGTLLGFYAEIRWKTTLDKWEGTPF